MGTKTFKTCDRCGAQFEGRHVGMPPAIYKLEVKLNRYRGNDLHKEIELCIPCSDGFWNLLNQFADPNVRHAVLRNE